MSASDEQAQRPRWEGDRQFAGVATGEAGAGAVESLARAMRQAGWLTEDPVGHLGPKLQAWAASEANRHWRLLSVVASETLLSVEVEWLRPDGRIRDLRADAYALIGSFAEASTNITQRTEGEAVVFEVATGQAADGFAPHGHLVRVRARRGRETSGG